MTEATKSNERGLRKVQEGVVLSTKMEKTIVVKVTRQVKHPLYGKYIRKTSKFYAHDEEKSAQVGDKVQIVESRPLSRLKRWNLQKIVAKAKVV